jgi:phosphonate degradation associated HDIG domain protein
MQQQAMRHSDRHSHSSTPADKLQPFLALLSERGSAQYGREPVSQLAHALQCARLAETAGETGSTVVAALLHDLGHLLQADPIADDPAQDDLHQFIALPFLRSIFSDAVLQPIRLHVDAKRYLCKVEPGYFDTLSPASVQSLQVQGGVLSEAAAKTFMQQPYAAEAVRLRRYDDLAKVPGLVVPGVAHFAKVARAMVL